MTADRLTRVLEALRTGRDSLLGHGGEAVVYALDGNRVARIHHQGSSEATVAARAALLRELARSRDRVGFEIPEVLDQTVIEEHVVTIERRFAGRPLAVLLETATGDERAESIRAYLDAAAEVGELAIERPWYGELYAGDAIRTLGFHDYLEQRARRSLDRAGEPFAGIDAAAIARALPEPERASFVHLDVFPGNVLIEQGRVSALLDFGPIAIVGDRRLDPLTAAAYLEPPITTAATDADRAVAGEWLAARGLRELFPAARRWAAALWTFASDDPKVSSWCRATLLGGDPA